MSATTLSLLRRRAQMRLQEFLRPFAIIVQWHRRLLPREHQHRRRRLRFQGLLWSKEERERERDRDRERERESPTSQSISRFPSDWRISHLCNFFPLNILQRKGRDWWGRRRRQRRRQRRWRWRRRRRGGLKMIQTKREREQKKKKFDDLRKTVLLKVIRNWNKNRKIKFLGKNFKKWGQR